MPATASRDPVPALNAKDGLALHGYDCSVGRAERIRSGDANWEALPKR